MRVTLGKRSERPIDITHRLDETFDVILTQELERDAFERVVEDIRLRVSNIDGMLTMLLGKTIAGTRWEICITEDDAFTGIGRLLFRGEIDAGSMKFDLRGEWMECTVFSLNRLFWDRAKTTRINRQFSDPEKSLVYAPLVFVLEREIGAGRRDSAGMPLFTGDLFGAIEMSDELASRQIRFYADAAGDNIVGNNGLYADLDFSTTVFDLLTAIGLYMNAECFVDCERDCLVIQKRCTVNNDRVNRGDPGAELSQRIVESGSDNSPALAWRPADDARYDYLYAAFEITRAPQPVYLGQVLSTATLLGTLAGGRYLTYYLTNLIGGYESAPSMPLRVYLQPNALLTGPGQNEMGSYHITLRIPAGTAATTGRRLYRTVAGSEDIVRLLAEFSGNASTAFEDVVSEQRNIPLPQEGFSSTAAWFSFDEETGRWNAPVLDCPAGVNEPAGKIFRILPELNFRNHNVPSIILPYDLYDVYAFFGKDNSFERIVALFDNLLMTVRMVECRVTGVNYRVGDTVSLFQNLIPGHSGVFVIKKASVNLTAEESTLELIAL